MKYINKFFYAAGLVVLMASISCKKESKIEIPPAQAHFAGAKNQSYIMSASTTPAYKITVGTTDVTSTDRTITFKVTSPSGAIAGTDYNLTGVTGNTVVIPAGKATADIGVSLVFARYQNAEKDTLVFTLSTPSVEVGKFQDTVVLAMRGPCSESEIVFTQLGGAYTKTFENGTYGPYSSSITSITPLTATTARAVITNIYDSGISAQAIFDWTVPGNFKVTVAAQQIGTLGGQPLFIRTTGSGGTFTFCTPFFTIPFELYTAAGTYDAWTTTMAR
jgi:hypothetical protein